MLGHAGGWDELLLAASAVLALIGVQAVRRGAATGPAVRGPCAYCGTLVEPVDRRCSGCGFRARVEEGP